MYIHTYVYIYVYVYMHTYRTDDKRAFLSLSNVHVCVHIRIFTIAYQAHLSSFKASASHKRNITKFTQPRPNTCMTTNKHQIKKKTGLLRRYPAVQHRSCIIQVTHTPGHAWASPRVRVTARTDTRTQARLIVCARLKVGASMRRGFPMWITTAFKRVPGLRAL